VFGQAGNLELLPVAAWWPTAELLVKPFFAPMVEQRREGDTIIDSCEI
jgi:hypothetical protein